MLQGFTPENNSQEKTMKHWYESKTIWLCLGSTHIF